jgi:hypothetical protein
MNFFTSREDEIDKDMSLNKIITFLLESTSFCTCKRKSQRSPPTQVEYSEPIIASIGFNICDPICEHPV